MKILAKHLNGEHIGMSTPIEMRVYVVHEYRRENALEYPASRNVYSEIVMITHTSKNTVKLRLKEGSDKTLQPDEEVELRELPKRNKLDYSIGKVKTEGGEMVLNDTWRFAVYVDEE